MINRQLTVAMLLAVGSQAASASGFALIEQSGSAQGTSYAGAAASTEDASVMWFNPAGLTEIKGQQLIVAGHVISPSSKFKNDDSVFTLPNNAVIPADGKNDNGATVGFVPNFYWKGDYAGYALGLGVNVPYGQHISYDEDWVGRYAATETDLKTVNINPSLATKVNDKLSLGFGLNVQYVDVLLEQKINQVAVGATDGNVKVTGDNIGFGYNLGALYKATDKLNVGISYRSKVNHKVEGEVKYKELSPAVTGALFDADASADVTLPATASLAIDYKLSDKTALLASTTWTGWSQYDELVVEFENNSPDSESNQRFKDSMRYAVGLIYQYSPNLKLRTGFAVDNTPVPDAEARTPRTPDVDRRWASFGLGYRVAKNLYLDTAYTRIWSDKADVNYDTVTSLGTSTLKGSYTASVNIFSAQLVWNY